MIVPEVVGLMATLILLLTLLRPFGIVGTRSHRSSPIW